ncbi:hypothetical protein M0R45_009134 [Rubus argutus]|uniref:Uncharacterized protein n=1 Tax=Rubus argutus TaxID=59490 RepID=A0AAW1Y5N5_RUBAR
MAAWVQRYFTAASQISSSLNCSFGIGCEKRQRRRRGSSDKGQSKAEHTTLDLTGGSGDVWLKWFHGGGLNWFGGLIGFAGNDFVVVMRLVIWFVEIGRGDGEGLGVDGEVNLSSSSYLCVSHLHCPQPPYLSNPITPSIINPCIFCHFPNLNHQLTAITKSQNPKINPGRINQSPCRRAQPPCSLADAVNNSSPGRRFSLSPSPTSPSRVHFDGAASLSPSLTSPSRVHFDGAASSPPPCPAIKPAPPSCSATAPAQIRVPSLLLVAGPSSRSCSHSHRRLHLTSTQFSQLDLPSINALSLLSNLLS